MVIDPDRMAKIYNDTEDASGDKHWSLPMLLSLLSFFLLGLFLYLIILRSSQSSKKIRDKILEADTITTEETIEDLECNGPYHAAFCQQYTLQAYQHEQKAVVRKIIWILGMKLVQTYSVVLALEGNIDNLASVRTAASSSVLVATNIWYVRYLLRRPYISHRPSSNIGDPMNDAEILTTRAVSLAAALLR
jgi:hypothetical protein